MRKLVFILCLVLLVSLSLFTQISERSPNCCTFVFTGSSTATLMFSIDNSRYYRAEESYYEINTFIIQPGKHKITFRFGYHEPFGTYEFKFDAGKMYDICYYEGRVALGIIGAISSEKELWGSFSSNVKLIDLR
ncbi:MAG: hypothetical protein ISS80_02735 [Candidatus Cloacimonetes bacterium]|nr:hypothetical protein [Candidatus Cloacimonadota bacterium]